MAVPDAALPEAAGKDPQGRKTREQKRHEAEVRNRFFRRTQELRKRIQEIESSLELATREREAAEAKLADPEVYRKGENVADLVKSHGDLKKRMEALSAEWETLSLQLEEIERQREAELAAPAPG